MKSMGKTKISILLLGYSALASLLVIVFYSFAYSGVALSLAALASLIYIFKSERSKFSSILYLLILILSFFIFSRTNEFLIFLNIIFMFFLGSVMAMPREFTRNSFGFLHLLITPIFLFFRSIYTKSEYDVDLRQFLEKEAKPKSEKIIELIISVAVSIVLLAIIVPLLASANPVFNKLLTNFPGIIYLREFFKWFFSDNISIWIFRLIFFGFLAFIVPRLLTFIQKGQEINSLKFNSLKFINLSLPKALSSIVLFIFFLTQLQFYLSTSETLLAMGITHSQYTREVFAQLLVVALIILGLVYNAKERSKISKALTVILVFEGIFLSFIALKSVYDYSFYWGFTHKRLWGFTAAFWIMGVFSFFIFKYLKDITNSFFVKSVIIFSGFVLIAVNILNFDFLIYHYRKSVTHRGVDYLYLSRLSSDSGSYGEQFQILEQSVIDKDKYYPDYYNYSFPGQNLLRRIKKLQDKYKNLDLRTFNLSEYLQYQEIKSIDTEKYMSLWAPVPPRVPFLPGEGPEIIMQEDMP